MVSARYSKRWIQAGAKIGRGMASPLTKSSFSPIIHSNILKYYRRHMHLFETCHSGCLFSLTELFAVGYEVSDKKALGPLVYTSVCVRAFVTEPNQFSFFVSLYYIIVEKKLKINRHINTCSFDKQPNKPKVICCFNANLINHYIISYIKLITEFDLITKFREISIEHLKRAQLANRGRLLQRTLSPVPLGTCICYNIKTIL